MGAELEICDGQVVEFHYILTDEEGGILDSSQDGLPLTYLHGAGNIVPGLESRMSGCTVGDSFKAVIPPSEGYGEYQEPGPQPVDRGEFPDSVDLESGAVFTVRAQSGQEFNVWITEVDGDTVYVDANHPLAGKTLTFDVEVVSIRTATHEELEHGRPDRTP